jgi:hypothetical protein
MKIMKMKIIMSKVHMKTEDGKLSVVMKTIMKEDDKSALESVEETIDIIMKKKGKTIMMEKMTTTTTDNGTKKIINVHGIVIKITMTKKNQNMTEMTDRKMRIKAQKISMMTMKKKTNITKENGRLEKKKMVMTITDKD